MRKCEVTGIMLNMTDSVLMNSLSGSYLLSDPLMAKCFVFNLYFLLDIFGYDKHHKVCSLS
jgi:hypothetical protein